MLGISLLHVMISFIQIILGTMLSKVHILTTLYIKQDVFVKHKCPR